jgi:hypothetical protein
MLLTHARLAGRRALVHSPRITCCAQAECKDFQPARLPDKRNSRLAAAAAIASAATGLLTSHAAHAHQLSLPPSTASSCRSCVRSSALATCALLGAASCMPYLPHFGALASASAALYIPAQPTLPERHALTARRMTAGPTHMQHLLAQQLRIVPPGSFVAPCEHFGGQRRWALCTQLHAGISPFASEATTHARPLHEPELLQQLPDDLKVACAGACLLSYKTLHDSVMSHRVRFGVPCNVACATSFHCVRCGQTMVPHAAPLRAHNAKHNARCTARHAAHDPRTTHCAPRRNGHNTTRSSKQMNILLLLAFFIPESARQATNPSRQQARACAKYANAQDLATMTPQPHPATPVATRRTKHHHIYLNASPPRSGLHGTPCCLTRL